MSGRERRKGPAEDGLGERDEQAPGWPGKRSLTSHLPPRSRPPADHEGDVGGVTALTTPVQLSGGGRFVEVETLHGIAADDIVGLWQATVVIGGVPEGKRDEVEGRYQLDVIEGLRDAIRAVPASEVPTRSFRIRLPYRAGRSPAQIRAEARNAAARAIPRRSPGEQARDEAQRDARDNPTVATEPPRDAQQAEREMAVQAVIDHLRPIHLAGAQVEMTFWVQRTAATLVGTRRIRDGEGPVRNTGLQHLADQLRRIWTTSLMGDAGRNVAFTFTLGASGWTQDAHRAGEPGAPPPEVHTLPVNSTGYSASARDGIGRAVDDILMAALDAADATYREVYTITFDDDRVVDVAPGTQTRTRSAEGSAHGQVRHGAQARRTVESALLPFSRGLGERRVQVTFDVAHQRPAPETTWSTVQSNVLRPAERDPDDFGAEYRAMHERILKDWREGVKDAALMVACMGVEHIAGNLFGGALFKVAGGIFGKAAPRLFKLFKGKQPSKEFLETLVQRLGKDQRDDAARLALKLHKGEKLTGADEKSLAAIYRALDDKVGVALNDQEKHLLRGAAFGKRYPAARPGAANAFAQAGRDWQVHHRIGLEYAHLYPDMDINGTANLIGLDDHVHSRISALWTTFRGKFPKHKVTTAQIDEMADIIDDEFGAFYHQVPNLKTVEARTAAAEAAARSRLMKLIEDAP